jgi:hypothetical protein
MNQVKFWANQEMSGAIGRWLAVSFWLSVGLGGGLSQAAIAQTPADELEQETLLLLTDPLELDLLQPGAVPEDESVITAQTIAQGHLTIPSLWWADQQFGGKLVDNWLAYSGNNGTPRRVDLVVNPQVWSLYTYLERYAFLTHFGIAAVDFGYNTRVFSRQQDLLGAYICDFEQPGIALPTNREDTLSTLNPVEDLAQLQCDIFLDPFGSGALRGRSTPFGGLQPIGGDTLR